MTEGKAVRYAAGRGSCDSGTGANVFLTGAPGAGKTYVLNEFIRQARADGASVSVTASTGIAATHINGVTIIHGVA